MDVKHGWSKRNMDIRQGHWNSVTSPSIYTILETSKMQSEISGSPWWTIGLETWRRGGQEVEGEVDGHYGQTVHRFK
jgi:hypothetical protein